MPRVCVVGSTNVDLTFVAPRLPRAGETLAGTGFHVACGGKGANQAVMAARLGAETCMVSCVGRDDFGEQALANYRAQGVDTRHVRRVDGPTGVAGIVVDADAQNCIVVVPGANAALTAADARAAGEVIRASDVLLAQLEVPVEATLEAFRLARAAGVRTVLNPAPAAALPDELLRLTDLCVPNETEAEALTGLPAGTVEEAEAAGRRLRRRGPPVVVVTLGARGTLLLEGEAVRHFPPTAVAAVDPTGAGDAFIGSLGVFLALGLSLADAVRDAGAVAALTVTRPGAQTSFPTRAEAEAFLAARWG
jgi:ribokinase